MVEARMANASATQIPELLMRLGRRSDLLSRSDWASAWITAG